MTKPRVCVLLCLLTTAGGCVDGTESSDRELPESRDAISLTVEPLLSLGGLDAPKEVAFSGVHSGFLGDSTFTVGDAGAFEIREFSFRGSLELRFGGRGQGPGEFGNIRWVSRKADSTIVLDARLARVSVFSSEGSFVRSLQLPVEAHGEAQWIESLGDEFLVATASGLDPRGLGGAARDSLDLFVIDGGSGGSGEASTATYTRLARVANRWWRPVDRPNAFGLEAVFDGPVALADAAYGSVWITENDEPTLISLRVGRPAQELIVHGPEARREPITSAEGISTRLYEQLVADSDGRLWLSHFLADSDGRRWDVLDDTGRVVGRAILPPDLRVLDIRRGHVLARRMDDLGVERVELWRIAGF